jgi:signal transduction histidine kinase/DNA-binding response OmpR family regulator/ligand-binding sensor domain-containing protein
MLMNVKKQIIKSFSFVISVISKKAVFFCISILFICEINCFSTKPYFPETVNPIIEPWRWRAFPSLSGKGIRCIAEGKSGTMWFGVNKGVISYDGLNWMQYGPEKDYIGAPVNNLHCDTNGNIYAGSAKGISIFKNNRWHYLFPIDKEKQCNITCFSILHDGRIIAGTDNGFLIVSDDSVLCFTTRSKKSNFENLDSRLSFVFLPDELMEEGQFPKVEDILETKPGEYWVLCSQGTEGKIFTFSNKKIIKHVIHDYNIITQLGGKKLGRAQQAIKIANNDLWIISGYYKVGIFHIKDNRPYYLRLSDKFGGDELHTCIKQMHDGKIWVGGLGRLFVLNKNQWDLYEGPELPIPSSRVIFHQSKNGDIWLSGIQNEVFLIDYTNKKWLTYNGLNYECQSVNNKKWFLSVDSRIVLNDKTTWISYGTEDGLIDAPVKVMFTTKGQVWTAGSHKGIAATAYFDGTLWHMQLHPKLSWGIDYRAVFESRDGSLWFGASVDNEITKGHQAGVLRLQHPLEEDERWTHFTGADGISQYNAYGIGESPDGKIWLGGTKLLNFNGKRWNEIEEPGYLKEFVNCIYSKPGGNLWVGSRHYGLFCFNGKEWKQYNSDNGLSSNSIISIYAVSDSDVWVATDKDFCHFDGENWTKKLFDQRFTLSREGGTITVTKDGSVWINKSLREWKRRAFTFNVAPHEAYVNFWSIRYKGDKNPPETKIVVYQDKVDYAGKTLISWKANDNWEETPSEKMMYSYRINSKNWSPYQYDNYVTLTNLKPGKYIFKVRSKDIDLNVDPHPAEVHFEVAPPVWRQGWFFMLLGIIILVIAYYEARILIRNKRLAKLNLDLNKVNIELKNQKEEMQQQKEKISLQKQDLENKNLLLEQQTEEITNQKNILEQMILKVEELSSVRLKFFTNISHEFRTPLSLISLSVEQLKRKFSDRNDNESNKLYDVIVRNSSRLLRLINQILEVRKIESGALDLNLRKGNLQLFINEIVNMFGSIAEVRNIDLQFKSASESLIADFDPDKIEKIIFNLLSNAIKNTPEFGSITISTEHSLTVPELPFKPATSYDSWIKIKIEDSGKGIPEQHLGRIFERFYQVTDNNNFIDNSGTGIGLAYTKDLVEVHQGNIFVESKIGIGTKFSIYIPHVVKYKPENVDLSIFDNTNISISNDLLLAIDFLHSSFDDIDPENIDLPNKEKEKSIILLVEDEHDLLKFLSDSFESEYIIKRADNGLSGLEIAKKAQPDLIISDVMMPQMDGIEMCNQLKNDIITSHIPIILLTAKAATEYKIEGLETGADDYIEKPFNLSVLKLKVKNLLNNRRKLWEYFKKEEIIKPEEIKVTSADEKLLLQIQNIIEKSFAEPDFDIDQMSKSVFLSRAHFTRKIKQITGYTPKELLALYRLKRSKQLLAQKKLTISEIAYMTGFEHPNSFSRSFRRYFGFSPSEFESQQ